MKRQVVGFKCTDVSEHITFITFPCDVISISETSADLSVYTVSHPGSTVLLKSLYARIIFPHHPNSPPPTPKAQQPLVGQGFLTAEVAEHIQDTPHSVGLLWTSNYPVAETST